MGKIPYQDILKWLERKRVSFFCRTSYQKNVKKIINRNSLPALDPVYEKEIKSFWGRYTRHPTTVFHRYYTGMNGIRDVRYIPEGFYYDKIECHYSSYMDWSFSSAYSDKGLFRRLLPDIKQPETIILNRGGFFYDKNYKIISEEEALEMAALENRFVAKPTMDSGGGRNVRFFDNPSHDRQIVREVFKEYGKDFLFQQPIKQHPKLSEIHAASLNTVRVLSLLKDGQVTILSSILRMGVNGSQVDNLCAGGLCAGVKPDGHLSQFAHNHAGKQVEVHPQGFVFKTGVVPSYDRLKESVIEAHKQLPYFGIISWDFAIDETGEPVMIEFNIRWGELNGHQINNGPLFGDRTEEILADVTQNEKTAEVHKPV